MARSSLPGLYRAQVISTEEFRERGEIRVRILGFTPEDEEKGWIWCKVMLPYGGLENMGMQYLPPIDAMGYIMYERGDGHTAVWVGSIMRFWGPTIEDGVAQPVEAQSETDFVIKTQYTKRDDREVASTENKVENVLKMNEEEFTLAKYHQTDQYQYADSEYELDGDRAINVIKLTDEEIKLKLRTGDNSEERLITMNEDQIKMVFGDGKSIIIEEDTITINQDSATIEIDGSGEVNVSSDKIVLNGENGTGMFYEVFRDFVNQAFNSHTHGSPAGPTSPPVTPFTNAPQGKSKHVKLS